MEVTYKNKVVNIPDKVTDLTNGQYTNVIKLTKLVSTDNESDKFLHLLEIVENVCGLTEDEVDEFSIEDINDLFIRVSEILKTYKF